MELEVKILNINTDIEKDKILKKGGRLLGEVSQQLYTYNLLSICGRFKEIIAHFDSDNSIEVEVNYEKLKNLFWEIDNYEPSPDLSFLGKTSVTHFSEILTCPDWKNVITNDLLISYIEKFNINPKKWIRLRRTNDKTTLAVKHILDNKGSVLQNLMETEITVPSFEETDALLQQLGFVHKSYQEKKRIIFELDGHEIDFDFWPGIPPFMEFEGSSMDDLKALLELLGYSMDDVVSCTADEVYRHYGKNMLGERTLIFD